MKTLTMLLIVLPSMSWGAFEPCVQGARAEGLGGAVVACADNGWTSFTNPSLLGAMDSRILSFSYSPELFGVPGISRSALSFVDPSPLGTFALSASTFGFSLYRETRLQLSYGVPIAGSVCVGGSLVCENLAIRHYGSVWTPAVDVGCGIAIGPLVRWGMAFSNALDAAIGSPPENLPEVMATGVCCRPVAEGLVCLDLVKDLRYPLEVRAGLEYTALELLSVRVGLTTEPSTYAAGVGIRVGFLQFDYACTGHPDLGLTHHIGLAFCPLEL